MASPTRPAKVLPEGAWTGIFSPSYINQLGAKQWGASWAQLFPGDGEADIMTALLGVSKGIDALTTAIGRVTFWLTLVMVLIGAFNVVTRYVGRELGVSLGGTLYIALQTQLFNLIFLLSAAYVLNKDGHVRVDILYANYSVRAKAWVDILGTLFFLFPFCALGMYLSWGYVGRSWQQGEVNTNAGGLPVYPIKTVILIAFGLLILQGVSEIIKRVAVLRGRLDTLEVEPARPSSVAPTAPSARGDRR